MAPDLSTLPGLVIYGLLVWDGFIRRRWRYDWRGPRFAKFCEHFIIHTKGPFAGRPLILESWQREFMDGRKPLVLKSRRRRSR